MHRYRTNAQTSLQRRAQAAWLAEKAEMERKIANKKLEKQMAMLSIKKDKEQEREAKEQALQDKEKADVAQKKAERKALNVQKFMNRITVRGNGFTSEQLVCTLKNVYSK